MTSPSAPNLKPAAAHLTQALITEIRVADGFRLGRSSGVKGN